MIHYIKGDATAPQTPGNKIIVHVCNDIGGWGKGFVMAISARWETPEKEYRRWYESKNAFELGEVQFVKVEEEIWVANMIGQEGIYKDKNGKPPIRYNAIDQALHKVTIFANQNAGSVHMPRIGCGLAGGKWEEIEPLILRTLCSKQIDVTVYDF